MKTKFKWVIKIEVDKTWVEDGFDITNDNIHELVSTWLPFAFGTEFEAKVIKKPDSRLIKKAQGY